MSHTPPKGSLEELFRHHLLESEAAAVPPRPQAWDQLENSLLLAQNEKYRRRLLVHRWAMAASLLLAAMATGGWWHSQQLAQPGLAQATRVALPAAGYGAGQPGRLPALVGPAALGPDRRAPVATGAASTLVSPANSLAIAQPATSSATVSTAASLTNRGFSVNGPRATAGALAAGGTYGHRYRAAKPDAATANDPATTVTDATQHQEAAEAAMAVAAAAAQQTALLTSEGQLPDGTAPLDARLARLALPASAGRPTVQGVELPAPAAAPHERSWQFGLAYASSFFQPNIDFTKDASAYNAALGASSVDLTRSAAAEYRSHLRGGLGQRLSLWASRRLGGSRFSLRTGLEVSQHDAQSASTVAFVGEQVPETSYLLPQPAPQLRTTTFRYRAASVPVEVSYHGAARPGFSLYAKLGGVLSTLFNVRSEVAGSPEAARTYTLNSMDSPYRPLTASVRGGLGVRFQPTTHYWSLNLGPVAEMGIMSLNSDPIQNFWEQKRPYSFGLEAGVELGRLPKIP